MATWRKPVCVCWLDDPLCSKAITASQPRAESSWQKSPAQKIKPLTRCCGYETNTTGDRTSFYRYLMIQSTVCNCPQTRIYQTIIPISCKRIKMKKKGKTKKKKKKSVFN